MPVVELTFDSSGALKGANEYQRASSEVVTSTGTIESSMGKAGTSFKNFATSARSAINGLGPAIAAGFAVAGAAVSGFLVKAADLAGTLEDTQGKFDSVFTGMTNTAEQWSQNLQQHYYLSENAAKSHLNSIQDLIVPTGMAREAAGQFSNQIVKMSSDLAAFNGLKTADVVRDFQSALAGGSETLTKYGINVKVAKVQQEALALGLIKTKDEMTDTIRVQALMSIALREGADAWGATARESENYASQLAQAKTHIETLVTTIGQSFLPAVTDVLQAFNQWITSGNNLNNVVNTTIETARFLANGVMGLGAALTGIVGIMATVVEYWVKGWAMMLKPITWTLEKLGILGDTAIPNLLSKVSSFGESARGAFSSMTDKIFAMNVGFDNMKIKTEAAGEAVKKPVEGLATMDSLLQSVAQSGNEAMGTASKTSAVTAQNASVAAQAANSAAQAQLSAAQATAQAAAFQGPGGQATLGGSGAGETSDGRGGYDYADPETGETSVSVGYGSAPSGATNIIVNQEVNRNDIAAIARETDRYDSRI